MKKRIIITGIRVKILIPILLVLFTAIIGLGIFAYQSQKQTLTNIMKQSTQLKVEDTTKLILERQKNMITLQQALNRYLVNITKGVAEIIQNIPDDQLNEEAKRLARNLNVREIRIIDENGILQWGNDSDDFGFDFNSSDQTKPLLEGLTNKNYALAQEAQPIDEEGTLFQYVTVARIDKPGLVQIGITPDEMQKLMESIDINHITKEEKIGKDGYIYIMDSTGTIVSHPDDNELGKKLTDYDWGSKVEKADTGTFLYNLNGTEMLLSYEKMAKYIIFGTIPTKEYYGQLEGLRRVIILVIALTGILASVIVYFVSNEFIIKRIKKMLKGVDQIGDGNLCVVLEDNGRDEIGQLFAGLSKMAGNLRSIVDQINSSSSKLNDMANSVAQASEQNSVTSQEIAQSINQIASGTSNQAEEVAISVEQLGLVARNIDDIIDSTKIMSEKVSSIEKQNQESLHTVNALKDKFAENKSATAQVMDIISVLADKSDKIGEISASITAISEQTNLLALNASIEAARAGEAGKGFSVVAGEVKKLAEQSANAAQSIGTLISEISSNIEEALKSINTATKTVGESDTKLKNTVDKFNSLKESNDILIELSEKMNEICISLNENTDKAERSLSNIAAVSEETAATAEEISASTEEQSASFMEITDSVNNVKELAKELTNLIKHLKTE